MLDPALEPLVERVRAAGAAGAQLAIRGGGTKDFYGERIVGEPFDVRGFAGISSYEPTELVISARCGTPLAELETTLAQQGQYLPFEPPRYTRGTPDGRAAGTVGGMVAAGLAGPARAAVGGVRDYVLGVTMLNGRGEVLSFGGQVMKNVAGYDVSRLLVGSLGILGVILEVSLKVLPVPPAVATLRFEMDEQGAIDRVNEWCRQPLPINASAWWEGTLVLRLAGARAAVEAAVARLGGERIETTLAQAFWSGLRDQHDEFFEAAHRAVEASSDERAPCALWRLSLPSTTPSLQLSGEQLTEWGGALRWLCTTTPATQIRETVARLGGHATLFAAQPKPTGVFAPLKAPLDRIHRELKKAFDPAGVFNPGRLYPGL
jgi:glycolate oxidase FAD binding subunit